MWTLIRVVKRSIVPVVRETFAVIVVTFIVRRTETSPRPLIHSRLSRTTHNAHIERLNQIRQASRLVDAMA